MLTNGLEGLGQHGREGLGKLVHVGGDLVVAVLDFVVADFVGLVEYHVAWSHVVVVAPLCHFFPHLRVVMITLFTSANVLFRS